MYPRQGFGSGLKIALDPVSAPGSGSKTGTQIRKTGDTLNKKTGSEILDNRTGKTI